jgi:succinate-acetate transporter protein
MVGTRSRHLVKAETRMLDLLFIVITIAFFLLAVAYVVGCERLE